MAMSLGTLASLGITAVVVGREVTKSQRKAKKSARTKPPKVEGPGGNYRLAVVQAGVVVGASCGSCSYYDGDPERYADTPTADGTCNYWKAPVGSMFVCDAYAPVSLGDVPEILWDQPDACWGWFLPEAWKVQVARPAFHDTVDEAGDPQALDPIALTHVVLDESMPDQCPIPVGDFTTYQIDVPGGPGFFPNEAVLGLYFHVLDEVERTLLQIVETGDGLLFSM